MLTEKRIRSERIQDMHRRYTELLKNDKRKTLSSIVKKFKNYIILFLETSSIHGLNHLISTGRHPFEVFLWLLIVALSLYGTVYASWMTWTRYQSSPTVISMERDMFDWNTFFPSVTICPTEKIDPKKLELYLSSSKEVDKEKLKTFIMALVNATYGNFDTVPEYAGIEPQDYMETLLNLAPSFTPSLTIGADRYTPFLHFMPTVTEMGLCYSVNSKIAVYNSPTYIRANKWEIYESDNTSISIHPLDGEVFAQVLNISAYNAYIHGPLEVPNIADKYLHSPSFFYMKLFFTCTSVYTSTEAALYDQINFVLINNLIFFRMKKGLKVHQRRCRFKHESELKHSPVYSYNMCRMECRIQFCLQYCQCIPHFYRRIGDEKICDVKGLHCIFEHKDVLIGLKRDLDGKKVDCKCYPMCHDARYTVQSYVLEPWVLGTNFQWGIVTYPRVRYRRDVMFGFTDVLVAFGGMAGLFLGCSVLSFAEITYFATLRLIFYARNTKDAVVQKF